RHARQPGRYFPNRAEIPEWKADDCYREGAGRWKARRAHTTRPVGAIRFAWPAECAAPRLLKVLPPNARASGIPALRSAENRCAQRFLIAAGRRFFAASA